MTHRIIISPIGKPGSRGQLYRVHTDDGAVLLEASRNPEFDASRALLARGITGQLEVWRPGCSYPSMRLDTALAAQLTVIESSTDGPRLANWSPLSEEAFCCRSGAAGKVTDEPAGTFLAESDTLTISATATASIDVPPERERRSEVARSEKAASEIVRVNFRPIPAPAYVRVKDY